MKLGKNLLDKNNLIAYFRNILSNFDYNHLLNINNKYYYNKKFDVACKNMSDDAKLIKLQIINEYLNFDDNKI